MANPVQTPGVPDLTYATDFISLQEEQSLISFLHASINLDGHGHVPHATGTCTYSLTPFCCTAKARVPGSILGIPTEFETLAMSLHGGSGHLYFMAEQIVVTEITTDSTATITIRCRHCYDDTVAIVWMGGSFEIEFHDFDGNPKKVVQIANRSLLVVSHMGQFLSRHRIRLLGKQSPSGAYAICLLTRGRYNPQAEPVR